MSQHHDKPDSGFAPDEQGGGFIPLTSLRRAAPRLDIAAIRERLKNARGRQYWQSLEELSDSPEFHRYIEREFPHAAPRDMKPLHRREFLRVMGATMALAGVAGCGYQPAEKIVPYVEAPEDLVPGKPLFFTTAFQRSGYGYGILGESHMGRPIKLEGNPKHPASLGATDLFGQASLLGLYDPDRSQTARYLANLSTVDSFQGALAERVPELRKNRGAGLRILVESFTSPTLAWQLRKLLQLYPQARIHQHDPAGRDNVRAGARKAFGAEVNPVYHFDQATVVLSLDSNFLVEEPGSVRYAREFVDGRRVRKDRTTMNRLYVAEATTTITGATADHRVPVRASRIEAFARTILDGVRGGSVEAQSASRATGVPGNWLTALVNDLRGARGASIVIPGAHQPPAVHALAHAINETLGNNGKTVTFTPPVEVHFPNEGTLRELADDLTAGQVSTLLILGGNPAYTAPADVPFAAALEAFSKATDEEGVPRSFSAHLGLYDDETGSRCQWHVPESHYLEAWGDVRAYDGTTTIVQPLIKPLYGSTSVHEILGQLIGQELLSGYDIVRGYWKAQHPGADFDGWWHRVLLSGVVPNTAAASTTVAVRGDLGTAPASPQAPAAGAGMDLVFRPDPTVWDGRYTNNGWLQEVPKPITQLTWDNAALISPATAEANKLSNGDLVELSYRGRKLQVPVWVTVGHPDDSVTLTLGYGRTEAGKIGNRTGFNAYTLRTSDAPWFGSGLQMTKAGGSYQLVSAQQYFTTDGRDIVREGTIAKFAANPARPDFMHGVEDPARLDNLYDEDLNGGRWPSDRTPKPPEPHGHPPVPAEPAGEGSHEDHGAEAGGEHEGHVPSFDARGYNDMAIPAWGMVIDVNACIGCNACVIACQAENNIPTIGKDQIAMHRQMHWIRIDTYFSGPDLSNPGTVFEPMLCQHCEKAPCEPVCPVEATSHSAEGINEMTYNRCIGTRYCQNNCPYKVRRFNFLQYSDMSTPTIQLLQNPDVTMRARGVMEKCTYCVQRINNGRIEAEKENRPIRDGDVVPACAQSCPTQAIFFGDLNDSRSHNGKGSVVRQLVAEPHNFTVLTELNTRPRTSYLARLRNYHPDLEQWEAGKQANPQVSNPQEAS